METSFASVSWFRMYGGTQLTTFAQTMHTDTTLYEKSCGMGVMLVWCGCGLGEGCQLCATVRMALTLNARFTNCLYCKI